MKMKSFNSYLTEKEAPEDGGSMTWCFLQGQIPVSRNETVDWETWKVPRGVMLDGVPRAEELTDIYQVDDIALFMRDGEGELTAFLKAVYGKAS